MYICSIFCVHIYISILYTYIYICRTHPMHAVQTHSTTKLLRLCCFIVDVLTCGFAISCLQQSAATFAMAHTSPVCKAEALELIIPTKQRWGDSNAEIAVVPLVREAAQETPLLPDAKG